MLALTAWPYFPHMVSDYLGPYEWLRDARMNPVDRHSLLSRASRLAEAADRGGDAYVALQTRAIATQIEIDAEPDRFTYLQLVERLLSCRFVLPDPDEVASLARDVDGGTGTVGVRVPNDGVARAIAEACGRPITATSANISGEPATANPDDVERMLGDRIDLLIDTGLLPGGLPSTIIDATSGEARLVRAGAVGWDEIERCLRGERV